MCVCMLLCMCSFILIMCGRGHSNVCDYRDGHPGGSGACSSRNFRLPESLFFGLIYSDCILLCIKYEEAQPPPTPTPTPIQLFSKWGEGRGAQAPLSTIFPPMIPIVYININIILLLWKNIHQWVWTIPMLKLKAILFSRWRTRFTNCCIFFTQECSKKQREYLEGDDYNSKILYTDCGTDMRWPKKNNHDHFFPAVCHIHTHSACDFTFTHSILIRRYWWSNSIFRRFDWVRHLCQFMKSDSITSCFMSSPQCFLSYVTTC